MIGIPPFARFSFPLTLVRYLATFAVLLFAAVARGDEKTDFFEKQIRPLLAERCYECHGIAKPSPMCTAMWSKGFWRKCVSRRVIGLGLLSWAHDQPFRPASS